MRQVSGYFSLHLENLDVAAGASFPRLCSNWGPWVRAMGEGHSCRKRHRASLGRQFPHHAISKSLLLCHENSRVPGVGGERKGPGGEVSRVP